MSTLVLPILVPLATAAVLMLAAKRPGTGLPPEFIIKHAENVRTALREVISNDPDIKILVLAAAVGGRGPGPLVASLVKDGVKWGDRKVPVTLVPGDLTDEEITELA